MQHYRLLRNNRESGPYSQQDLIDLGLKAYDLIWIEGKSFSWRYPSEVEALKSFAPVAEEDLYVLLNTPKIAGQTNSPVVSTSTVNTNITTTLPKITGRRYVSVILPNTISPNIGPQTANAVSDPNLTLQQVSLLKDEFVPENFEEDSRIAVANTIPYKSKDRYLIAAAFLVLLTIGIYFGTTRNNSPVAVQERPVPVESSLVSLTTDAPELKGGTVNPGEVPGLPPNKLLEFAALKRFVHVTPSDFQVGYFGGISGLALSIRNSGKTKLKNIAIAVDYLGKDKTIHHTENILIPLLDSQKTILIPVPESPDGVAIQTRVIGVNDLSAQ